VGLPLMRRIMLQIFFIGVWLLSFETYDLQQFRLLNLIVRLEITGNMEFAETTVDMAALVHLHGI
jgi:hypothetical protein